MAEITPLGVSVSGLPTDVRGQAAVPGVREVLENVYNDFLDAKQKGEIALDMTFDSWIAMSIKMLAGHRHKEIGEQYAMGQIGRSEFEALEEFRKKLLAILQRCDPRQWDFDQYGIQYVQPENRHLFRERVGKSDVVTAMHRDLKIKTGPENGIIRL